MYKQPNNTKITALYERLSRDDEQKNESISIAHQKQILEDYAQRNGFTNIRHFADDGVTGTIFNRPGLNAMVEEVKAGNVATVIIKDQSRIGRDVVEVGILKRTFDEYNVRFIAAEDGLDTANGFDIMSIFRDVINEFHVADTSKKIKAVFKSRMERGLRCSGSIPYGYLFDKEDKDKLIIDEAAAEVVRRIFHMVIDGKGVNEIGRILRAEQIPIPSEHWKRVGHPVRCAKYADPYAWSGTTIGYILKRPEYMGRKVLGKTVKESYKTKKHRKTEQDEQYIFDGEMPVIIDEETWHNAQRLRKTVRRPPKKEGPPHRLTGLLFCADCGSKLTHRINMVQGKWLDDACVCSSYRQLTRDCTMHYIPTKNVERLILSAIQRISWYVKHNEKEFVQKVREASSVQQEETVKACRRQLRQSEKRYAELDGLVKKLYEQNVSGKLSDRHYERLLADYDTEQSNLEATMTELQTQINAWGEDKLKTDKFIELVKRYTDFSELTTPMLNEFVEKVIVHEANKRRGTGRRMRVDIHMNFIGAFEVPIDVVTPIELENQRRAMQELEAKAQKSQELYQVRYERRKQEKREFTARMRAGVLTPEEMEAHEQKKAKNRARQKEWRDKRNASLPSKPPKVKAPTTHEVMKDIGERRRAGLPLTPEEIEMHNKYRERNNVKARQRRERIKAEAPPKPPKAKKPTKKDIISDIIARKNAGLTLTSEEHEAYAQHRETCNAKHKKWRDSKAVDNTENLTIEDIKKSLRDGISLTPEQAIIYDAWIAKKNGYRRELYQRKRADRLEAVGQ